MQISTPASAGTTIYIFKNYDLAKLHTISASDHTADETGCIYEIIRVIGGIPLFFEDHMARFDRSLELSGRPAVPGLPHDALKQRLIELVRANGLTDCNVKAALLPDAENTLYMYISPHYYPSFDQVTHGVPVTVAKIERQNPNAKQLNSDYKRKCAEIIKEKDVFEVLLEDRNGVITEGSRTNVFFIKGDTVMTAPESMVLKGITRDHVLTACVRAGAKIADKALNVKKLDGIDAAFITGTSIKVLPISDIDGLRMNTANPLMRAVAAEFDKLVAADLRRE